MYAQLPIAWLRRAPKTLPTYGVGSSRDVTCTAVKCGFRAPAADGRYLKLVIMAESEQRTGRIGFSCTHLPLYRDCGRSLTIVLENFKLCVRFWPTYLRFIEASRSKHLVELDVLCEHVASITFMTSLTNH